ncbi:hypothetical protein H8356DRAFT_1347933 [Neocallimastix lanati (nom. inval.)]|nr:hypothetical protein H8356DRAFT_1347933 [Neocallimastix sp. JGI-2020a]
MDDSHNHLENKFEVAKSIISNSSIPFNVSLKRLICPRYNSIKSQVTRRRRRKQLPPNMTTFDEISNESKYYKTILRK